MDSLMGRKVEVFRGPDEGLGGIVLAEDRNAAGVEFVLILRQPSRFRDKFHERRSNVRLVREDATTD